jgi:hypothetical protein
MATGINVIDESNGSLPIADHSDFAANLMLVKRLANKEDIGPVVFNEHDARRSHGSLRFSRIRRREG